MTAPEQGCKHPEEKRYVCACQNDLVKALHEENSRLEERFENAAQWNARFEGQIEKMGNLLHLCREAFLDIENHSIDTRKGSLEFWQGYIHEVAYNMNKIIFEAEEKHGLPIRPVAQANGTTKEKADGISRMVEKP